MQPRDVVLAFLEVEQFVADAFFDEDPARVLLDDRLLVLLRSVWSMTNGDMCGGAHL